MKKILSLGICLFFGAHALFAQSNDIVGDWTTEDGKTIKIFKKNDSYVGTTTDGAPILLNLEYNDDAWHGKIQNRSGSRSARCEIVMQSDDQIKIVARKGFLSKRFHWNRKE